MTWNEFCSVNKNLIFCETCNSTNHDGLVELKLPKDDFRYGKDARFWPFQLKENLINNLNDFKLAQSVFVLATQFGCHIDAARW